MTREAIYFGPEGGESFGWLHRPVIPARLGLVICSSFGREELCSHRTLRHLAEAASRAGLPALRFDYPGTGDSAGAELAPGRWAAWVESVRDAIDALKRYAGVEQVCVLGFRLGALIGAEAARGRADVAAFAGFAPVISGRAFVRELRVFGMKTARSGGAPDAAHADLLESGGYAMNRETQEALSGRDLLKAVAPPARRVLVIDRDDRPDSAQPWVQFLREAGATVTTTCVAGYAEMMAPPHHSVVPAALIGEITDWLQRLQADLPQRPAVGSQPRLPEPPRTVVWAAAVQGGADVQESACVVDAAIGLTGILSVPVGASAANPPRRAVVLLPPGADRRLGPGRGYVGLARAWASQGIAVLRLDIAGAGDSPPRPGCQENVVYGAEAVSDLAAAIGYFRNTLGVQRCHLVGHCSGAYNALKAAVALVPVESVVLINPLVFFWKPGMSVDNELSEPRIAYAARNFQKNVLSPARWWGLVREPRKVGYALNVVARRPLAIAKHAVRDLLRQGGVSFEEDLSRELIQVVEHGVGMQFVFATGDPGEALLRSLGGRTVQRLMNEGKLGILRIEGADHDFTHERERQALWSTLMALFDETADTAGGRVVTIRNGSALRERKFA